MIFNCGHIVLDLLVRVGDRVIFNADESGESWAYKKAEERALQGTRGTVVGFETYNDYVGRMHQSGRRAGIYKAEGAVVVEWDDGHKSSPSLHDISWWPWAKGEQPAADVVELVKAIRAHGEATHEKRQAERSMDFKEEWAKKRVFVGELPELPFFEMDRVMDGDGQEFVIRSINWHWMDLRRDDGSAMSMLCAQSMERGYTTNLGVDEVKLVERGNLFKWLNGERERMSFSGEAEEVAFYDALGMVEVVGSFDASPDGPAAGALEVIATGKGDGIRLVAVPFNPGKKLLEVVRVKERMVGERVRQKTMAGFGIAAMA